MEKEFPEAEVFPIKNKLKKPMHILLMGFLKLRLHYEFLRQLTVDGFDHPALAPRWQTLK